MRFDELGPRVERRATGVARSDRLTASLGIEIQLTGPRSAGITEPLSGCGRDGRGEQAETERNDFERRHCILLIGPAGNPQDRHECIGVVHEQPEMPTGFGADPGHDDREHPWVIAERKTEHCEPSITTLQEPTGLQRS
jgi:hypothetical protein